jgi:hypothetical protein
MMQIGRYIPKGAIKVADKKSDAVAYLYDGGEQARAGGKPVPCARVFYGKQSKPVAAYQFKDAEQRAAKVAAYFTARQQYQAMKADQAAKRKAQGRSVEVGQFLCSSWGYDQTNVNFYKVTKLVGTTMVEAVAVGQISVGGEGGAAFTDKVIPAEEPAAGAKTYRLVMKAGAGQINGNYVRAWDGKPMFTSSYA